MTDPVSQAYLDRFDPPLLAKAQRLQVGGCVKSLTGHAQRLEARVEFSGESFQTTLSRPNGSWEGSVSPNGPNGNLALVITMLEWLARPQTLLSTAQANPSTDLRRTLEEKLGRLLAPAEEQFLIKLERRYERYRTEKAVYDHDLVRLNPRWPMETTEPLRLWPTPPGTILEFWNYLAYAFSRKRLAFPNFMQPLTDLETTKERIFAWETDKDLDQWNQRITDLVRQPSFSSSISGSCRLLATPHEVRIQWKYGAKPATKTEPAEEAQTDWQDADDSRLAEWARLYREGRLELDADSQLVWLAFLEHFHGQPPLARLLLEQVENATWLGHIFEQGAIHPILRSKILTLDGDPFLEVPQPLRWICKEIPPNPSANGTGSMFHYKLSLIQQDGSPLRCYLRYLPGRVPRYLTHEEIFTGPVFWGSDTEVQDSYLLPAAAVETTLGVDFLYKLGLDLPPTLRDRLEDLHFEVTMTAQLLTQAEGVGVEHLLMFSRARDTTDTTEAVFTQDSWSFTELKPAPPGVLRRFSRDTLNLVPTELQKLGLTYDIGQDAYKARITKAFPSRFAEWMAQLPPELKLEIADPRLLSLRDSPIRAKVRFNLESSGIDWFDLTMALDVGDEELTPAELKSLVTARGDYVRMKDGSWKRLEIDLDPAQQEAVLQLGLDVFDMSGQKHRVHLLHLNEATMKSAFGADTWTLLRKRLAERKAETAPVVPLDLKADLRPYQVKGFHFLAYLTTNGFGGILADDMGLGKTVQALCWLLWLRQRMPEGAPHQPTLVICPKSVLDVWSAEVVKFAPHLRCRVLRDKSDMDVQALNTRIDLLAMNYAQLRGCGEKLKEVHWLAVILDEGQQIKNPDSKAAKAAREIEADSRIVLTGTPIENRLLDIWSLMAFAMPGVLGDRAYFSKRFDRRKDPQAQERLSARLRPFLLRRAKKQVLQELPPRTEEDVLCTMEEGQREVYQKELKAIQESLIARLWRKEDSQMLVLQGLMRLRQICCHPVLVDKTNTEAESAKMNALFYLLNQLKDEGHKVLVFSQFVTMLDIIKARLETEGRTYHYLTGQTQNRGEVVASFQSSHEPSVFLLSLRAGGSGLNLTAASYVILFDPWWNPAVEAQAIDRTHRIGQKNHVIAYRLFIRDSVEEKIRILQQRKRQLSEDVLGEESFAKNLDESDLKFIFSFEGD